MAKSGYLAFDLGAESGRAMLAVVANERITLEETHRFPNVMQRLPSGYHWNLLDLWGNLVQGLGKSANLAKQKKVKLVSLGVDTWGVDYGLVGRSGQLLGQPFAYRDSRNPPAMARTIKKLGAQRIYQVTGIQFLPFNTLFQLAADQASEPAVLAQTWRLLLIPDLLHYFFSGTAVNEATIASTSQMIDPRSGRWAGKLLKQLGLPTGMLGKIVPAGTAIGHLRPEVAQAAGVPGLKLKVIVPGAHDTASAVAAVPVDVAAGKSWAYISSGTWSLMGAELDRPLISPASQAAGFTNERGVEDKIRFLKNIAGLWLVQEVRRDLLSKGQEYSYAQLAKLAAQAQPFRTLINPDHAPFASPGGAIAKHAAYAKATGQKPARTAGQLVRSCLESLALTYRQTLDQLEGLLGQKVEVLHIVGGGGQNELLNQMTADAINRPVVVGPYEATAVGNALTQAIGHGQVRDLAHLRKIVRKSFELKTFTASDSQRFEQQMARFQALKK